MSKLKVSVTVPFYNSAATLGRTLESLAASSYGNLEVLMVDDCSTDGGGSAAEAFARRDGRFRYFRNDTNRKVSFCRNRGMAEATGDFILFVDGDDWISADWIQNLVNDAAGTGAEVVIGKSRRVQAGRESDFRMKGLRRRGCLRFEDVVLKDNSVVWNKLYSAALLKREHIRFEESLFIGEDLLFNFQALGRARGIFYGDAGSYYYRADNEHSIMRSSPPAVYGSNMSGLLRRLVDCDMLMERKNPSALRKVARDILMNHYRFMQGPLDEPTMKLIREIDSSLPFRARFSRFRKAARRILFRQPRA
jgi:glycosyltransferase involved in cell wall biosynthesis